VTTVGLLRAFVQLCRESETDDQRPA